jgi:hypothetical protein
LVNFVHLKIAYHSGSTVIYTPLELFQFPQSIFAIPVLPSADDGAGITQNTIDITVQANAGGNARATIWALFDANPLWLTVFPLPQIQPNQAPTVQGSTNLANSASLWLVVPTANVKISLFEVITLFIQGTFVGAGYYLVGHGTVLPVAQPPQANWLFLSGNTGAFTYEYHGAQLPAGDGIYIFNASGNPLLSWHLVNYSLS